MPVANKALWINYSAQQPATVTQRTDEIENEKIRSGQRIDSGHAIHVPDSRTRMEGIDPLEGDEISGPTDLSGHLRFAGRPAPSASSSGRRASSSEPKPLQSPAFNSSRARS